jgi:hypothetical protein
MDYPNIICDFTIAKQVRKRCNRLFVDSGILQEERKLDKIIKNQRFGDVVAPPDIIDDPDQTIKNTLEWFKISKYIHPIDHMCFVLQGKIKSDYIDCYEELLNHIPNMKYIGLGGLAKSTKNDSQVKEVLSLIPYFHKKKLKVHIFGLGTRWIKTLINYQPYSFDSSTPIRNAIDYCILDDNLNSVTVRRRYRKDDCKLIPLIAQINNYQVVKYIKDFKNRQTGLELEWR